jgi:hypothetical protein
MARLVIEPRLEHADEVYAELIDAHRDLAPEQSQAFNARLVLLLINHIGDAGVVREAIRLAAQGEAKASSSGPV